MTAPRRRDWSVIWRDRWFAIGMLVPATLGVVVLRELDVIADTPLWAYVAGLAFAQAVAMWAAAVFPPGGDERSVWWRAFFHVASAAVPIYMTGLGPMLAVGFVTLAADQIRRDGARAARPVYVWSVLTLGVGEILIAADIAPSLLRDDDSHGVAAVMAVVMAASIVLFANVAGQRERTEQTSARLLDLAHALAESGPRRDVAQRLADATPNVLGLQRALVVLRDGDDLSVAGTHGYAPELDDALRALTLSSDTSPMIARILADPELLHITPAVDDPFVRGMFETFGAVESYVAPVFAAGQVVAFIVADRTEGPARGLTPTLAQRLRGLADQAAIALENGRLIEHERAAIVQLRDSDRMKSEFLAVVSHELRTPLSVMMGAARTMQWRGGDLPDEVRSDLIESIVRRGEQLNRLVEDLLQASGDIHLEVAPVDLRSVVRTAVADSNALHPEAEISVTAPAQDVIVRADAFRIRQVVDNLLENAHKYGEGGAIDVTVSSADDVASIGVSDTGPGMTPEDAAHAFDAFYQADSSTVRRAGGLGLGLHICRRIVEAHGGRIRLESAPSAGTRVHVTLPTAGPAD